MSNGLFSGLFTAYNCISNSITEQVENKYLVAFLMHRTGNKIFHGEKDGRYYEKG